MTDTVQEAAASVQEKTSAVQAEAKSAVAQVQAKAESVKSAVQTDIAKIEATFGSVKASVEAHKKVVVAVAVVAALLFVALKLHPYVLSLLK